MARGRVGSAGGAVDWSSDEVVGDFGIVGMAGIDGIGEASDDEAGGISDGTEEVVDGKAVGIFVVDGVDVDGVDEGDCVDEVDGRDGVAGVVDGSEVDGLSAGVVDGKLLVELVGKLLVVAAGGLGNDGCVVTTVAGLPGVGGTGSALGELTVCAGILLELLLEPGNGLEGTEGTETFVESLCILDDNSSDGILGVESAGVVGTAGGNDVGTAGGNVDGTPDCGVTLGRAGG